MQELLQCSENYTCKKTAACTVVNVVLLILALIYQNVGINSNSIDKDSAWSHLSLRLFNWGYTVHLHYKHHMHEPLKVAQ